MLYLRILWFYGSRLKVPVNAWPLCGALASVLRGSSSQVPLMRPPFTRNFPTLFLARLLPMRHSINFTSTLVAKYAAMFASTPKAMHVPRPLASRQIPTDRDNEERG